MLRALAVVAVLLGSVSAAAAQTAITLAWDANTESDIAGYEVSYGTQSGVYSTVVDVGNVTSQPFTITSGVVYYFAVKAYNTASPRQYSPYSMEVSTAGTATVVVKTTPVITWATPSSVVAGTVLGATQLNATANVAGTFAYTPASGTVLTEGTQTLSVAFTPTDTVNYTTATGTVTLTVAAIAKTTPVITWATPASIVYGTALSDTQLNATANVAGTFVYSPAAGTILKAGTQTLSVAFTPTDTTNYTTATKTVTISVVKATTTVTWSSGKRITKGKPLSSTELNATATTTTVTGAARTDGTTTVAGTFTYNPPAGTVLDVGTYTLSVTFAPADSTDYAAATATTSLDVVPAPTLAAAPATLRFAGTNTSGTLGPITAPQAATVTFSTRVATAWTASADQPWVRITNGSGTGSGMFTVGIVNPGDVLGAATSASATITVTAADTSYAPQAVTVTLTLQPASANQAPIGAFDTPVDGASGLQGSFAVTGWALDDVGVDRVELWRDLVEGEDPTHAYTTDLSHPAYGKVFIANPLFVANSRPDVEGLYSTYPSANRAGWGYLLLSWGLPNQGNGVYTLYAFAFDGDGRHTALGTRTVTMDNAHSTRPFGALDTPGYGATVSGAFWNYGWALTPGTECAVTNGRVSMAIDSRPYVTAQYGAARSDIAAAFPGSTDARNAGGAYYLDTSKLTNGLHQIGWVVTDSCGRKDGIGSRFFTVMNGAARSAGSDQTVGEQVIAPAQEPGIAEGRTESHPDDPSQTSEPVPAPASAARPAGDSTDAQPETVLEDAAPGAVAIRHLGGDWQGVQLDGEGRYTVDIAQGERIEVRLPRVEGKYAAGFHEVQEQRRLLPLGSSFNARDGIFYWQPDAAFLGTFDLVFEAAGGEAVRMRVVVK